MVVFFDILLLDDDACLRAPHRERRLLLQDVVQTIPGRAAIAEQEILDFGRFDSQHRLEVSFSRAIAQRWEGYVLKACEEPYFPMYSAGVDKTFGRWIKLKKDYIPGLGDTVDLTLIGGYYDAHDAAASSKRLRWTHLLVGCLLNKEEIELSRAVPRFKVIDMVNHHCMHRDVLQYFNQIGEFYASDPEGFEGFDVEYGHSNLRRATSLFMKPFVVEMMGSGFEKPSNARYFTLRFPRILKIHNDRTFREAASYRELQLLAEHARSIPDDDLSQEREEWRKRLKVGNGLNQYVVQRSRSPSSRSSSVEADAYGEGAESPDTSHNEDDPFSLLSGGNSQQAPIHTGRGSTRSSEGSPAVYIEETIFPEEPGCSNEDGVLAENDNLSRRQTFAQKGADSLSQKLNTPSELPPEKVWMKAKPAISSNSQTPSIASMHHEQVQRSDFMVFSSSEDNKPRSPLTTIPVYLSGTPSNLLTRKEGSSGLHKFLQALGSTESRSSLQQSNPKAVSQGTAFGIALINPRESSLGQEIHKIAQALQSFRTRQSCPSPGRVFFLDSGILEQEIQPEDLQFCLRATWVDLGRKYYYACLHWDFGPDSSREVGQELRSHAQLETHKRSGPGRPPVAVRFDRNDILALGEYKSIDPLVDINDTP
jgi:DNA ligase-4